MLVHVLDYKYRGLITVRHGDMKWGICTDALGSFGVFDKPKIHTSQDERKTEGKTHRLEGSSLKDLLAAGFW